MATHKEIVDANFVFVVAVMTRSSSIPGGIAVSKKVIIGMSAGVVGVLASLIAAFGVFGGPSVFAIDGTSCADLPTHLDLETALVQARGEANGGFGLDMWGTIVNRDGEVCQVAFTGGDRGDQWPGSRVISAQKANTANAFSLPGLALSTANLFSATQPGGFLYGLQHSNPVDTSVAYAGPSADYGTDVPGDPMEGNKIGGVNVFGGGVALYDENGDLLGALGVSGDSSCADHNIAWKTRHFLNHDNVPAGVSATGDDNIINDIVGSKGNFSSKGGFGHAECSSASTDIAEDLPSTHPVGPAA